MENKTDYPLDGMIHHITDDKYFVSLKFSDGTIKEINIDKENMRYLTGLFDNAII